MMDTIVGTKLCVLPTALACELKWDKCMYYVNWKDHLIQPAENYYLWEMFEVWTVYASLAATVRIQRENPC
jgi:hypothetical protein